MATQLAESFDGGDEGQGEAQIDYEAKAREWGWKPPEQLKDPSKGVDAKTFYERGQEVLPLLKAQNKKLEARLEQMERSNRQAAEFFSKAEERAREAAIAELRREMADAVETGDAKAANAVIDKLGKLDKPTEATKPADDEAKRAEEFADWMTENRWYSNDGPAALRIYADAQAEKLKKANNGVLSLDDLNTVADMVKAKYSKAYPEAFGDIASPKPRNPVDAGGTAPARRAGKTFADLPPDAQRICDKWVANKIIKSRDDYVKSYAW